MDVGTPEDALQHRRCPLKSKGTFGGEWHLRSDNPDLPPTKFLAAPRSGSGVPIPVIPRPSRATPELAIAGCDRHSRRRRLLIDFA